MTPNADSHSHDERVFRLSYASRATKPLHRAAAEQLASAAAEYNRRNAVSGVLFAERGLFLQWLEGPAPKVCEVMSRIVSDPRHTDITILSAGWVPERRFAGWAMQLADTPLPRNLVAWATAPGFASLCDTAPAVDAFEAAAAHYQRLRNHAGGFLPLQDFARKLIQRAPDQSPSLPTAAAENLHARAQFVDDVCGEFLLGWEEDLWTSVEIAIGMAHLNLIWQRSGRVLQPSEPRQCVAVVVPPDSGEILGAIVKADLLRAAGVAVRMIRASNTPATIDALSGLDLDAIIVSGSRLGWSDDQKRAGALADSIRKHCPATPTYLGGRPAGTLDGWPERIARLRDDAAAIPTAEVDWLALSSLAAGAGVPTPRRHAAAGPGSGSRLDPG